MVLYHYFIIRWCQIFILTLAVTCQLTWSLTQRSPDFQAIQLDYKVEIGAGKEDCYHQFIMNGSIIYCEFQVLKGGDGKAGFVVKQPDGTIVMPYEWRPGNIWETQEAMGGYYTLCIDNSYSKLSSKLVSLYLHSFLAEDSAAFLKELAEIEIQAENFTKTLSNVDGNMASVLKILHFSKTREYRHLASLQDSQAYVTFWSIIQCIIIISTSAGTVYFIRKLFDAPATFSRKTHVYHQPEEQPEEPNFFF